LQSQGIVPGDRVGILGHNSIHWLIADFAILSVGAVTVPAYFTDPAEAVQFVFNDAGCRLILVEEGEQQAKMMGCAIPHCPFGAAVGESLAAIEVNAVWDGKLAETKPDRSMLATLIYTSGTTGLPKGVMLTHGNLLSDVAAGLGGVPVSPDDLFLSFLPVSHAFERTVGHFLAVASGSEIAYAEDVTTLMRDMPEVRPTVMISVPRLYEKIYAGVLEKVQQGSALKRMLFRSAQELGVRRFDLRLRGKQLSGFAALRWRLLDHLVNAKLRQKMGGRLRLFVSGGAALSPTIARFLLAADITVLPGYGLSETSPVLTVNRHALIKPETVGPALPGVQLKLDTDGELLVKGPMVMQGYWNRPQENAEVFDSDGWLRTGDLAEIDQDGYVRIVDRKKEIMVLSNGENVAPAAVEQHLVQDPCVLQAMIVADEHPYVAALIVPDQPHLASHWQADTGRQLPSNWRQDVQVSEWLLARMAQATHDLPSYMRVQRFLFVPEEWTQANGLLTPTMKLKRRRIVELHQTEIAALYAA